MTMIERAVRAAIDSRATQVVVVTGWQADRVEVAVEAVPASKPVTLVRNPQYATGLASSLRCAVANAARVDRCGAGAAGRYAVGPRGAHRPVDRGVRSARAGHRGSGTRGPARSPGRLAAASFFGSA